VGRSCDLGDMYLRLMAQGHQVRVCIEDFAEHGTMGGLVERVDDYRRELDWVREAGPDGGLILFESAEHGEAQDALRRDGFFVVGGSAWGDRLENDRAFGQAVLADVGMRTVPGRTFTDFDAAIAFIRQRPQRYAFKLNGSETSSWRNYVGQAADGSDMIAMLQTQRERLMMVDICESRFLLMDFVEGVETGIGAYFDGERFLWPACIDFEHKRFFPGDVGELTGEMGTLVSYQNSQRLFELTLHKLTGQLRDGGYVGYVNLNTIINEDGIWPLELTCRFGYPGFAILDALQPDGWGGMFEAMRTRQARFKFTPGFAVGVVLCVPPYPYRYGYAQISRGLPIVFDAELTLAQRAGLHLGEVALQHGRLVTSGVIGYTMVATGVGSTVAEAKREAYALARRVYVPNLRYRNDIGDSFVRSGERRLRELGYL